VLEQHTGTSWITTDIHGQTPNFFPTITSVRNADELVSEIRTELNSATPAPSRFEVLATAAVTSIATAAGTASARQSSRRR
jgi:hypothetical protein